MEEFDIELLECERCESIETHECYKFLKENGDYDCITVCEACGHEIKFTYRGSEPKGKDFDMSDIPF